MVRWLSESASARPLVAAHLASGSAVDRLIVDIRKTDSKIFWCREKEHRRANGVRRHIPSYVVFSNWKTNVVLSNCVPNQDWIIFYKMVHKQTFLGTLSARGETSRQDGISEYSNPKGTWRFVRPLVCSYHLALYLITVSQITRGFSPVLVESLPYTPPLLRMGTSQTVGPLRILFGWCWHPRGWTRRSVQPQRKMIMIVPLKIHCQKYTDKSATNNPRWISNGSSTWIFQVKGDTRLTMDAFSKGLIMHRSTTRRKCTDCAEYIQIKNVSFAATPDWSRSFCVELLGVHPYNFLTVCNFQNIENVFLILTSWLSNVCLIALPPQSHDRDLCSTNVLMSTDRRGLGINKIPF